MSFLVNKKVTISKMLWYEESNIFQDVLLLKISKGAWGAVTLRYVRSHCNHATLLWIIIL